MTSTADLCDCRVDELEFLGTVYGVVRRRHTVHIHDIDSCSYTHIVWNAASNGGRLRGTC